MRKILLTSIAVFIGLVSQAQVISTVAGGGLSDGVPAITAPLDNPFGTAVDAAGNIYIADYYNYRIRKVDATTGVITTVAGNGTEGYSGDGSAATSAQLDCPIGVAIDAAGNLYIVDFYNNRIRMVTAATGIITTIAGNGTQGYSGDGTAATLAQLNRPTGVAVDIDGNLYIADQRNNRIRKVTATTGIITTIAGNGTQGYSGDESAATSAQLFYPFGVAVDAAGNLYIADYYNNRIRKVTATTGVITTVAGNGTKGYSGDGSAATSAQLNEPAGVAVDAAGNLYVADQFNARIRKVTAATGNITTVAGNGMSGYSGDGGAATSAQLASTIAVALDAAENLYIVDQGNFRIRKVTAATGIITTVAGNGEPEYYGDGGTATLAQINSQTGVAIDADGNLYIAEYANNRIRKVDATTGIITTVAGNGTRGYSGDGGAATSAQLHGPAAIAIDATGNLYIADQSNFRIRKVTAATGIISTVAGGGTLGDGSAATSASLNLPYGVAIDAAGNLYIADQYNQTIRKVTATTGIITTVAGNGTGGYSGDGGAATSASLTFPTGVAVDAAGNLYIDDQYNQTIRKVTAATGIITTVAGNGTEGYSGDGSTATSAQLNVPSDMAIDAAGNIYIADYYNQRIRKVTAATGIITTMAGNGTGGYSGDGGAAILAQLNFPAGVTLDAAGNLYIAEAGNNRIRKISVPISITVTANANQSKAYGLADPTLTYSVNPALQSGDAFTGSLSRDAGESVGTYAINQGNLSAGAKYSITFVPANFNITAKTITVTADTDQSKVYGAADPTLTYSVTPALQSGDALTGALGRAAGESVGAYAINQGNLSAGTNYSITFVPANFNITAKTITVTADADQSKVYGAADPALTYSVNPALQSGDAFTGVLGRVVGESVGTYAINQGDLSAGANYTITFVGDNFSITKATPTITWNDPADIASGTPLSDAQLNATADVPGTFAYTPPAGTVLEVGNSQGLAALFTPTDGINYTTASKTVQISVTATSGINELSESMVDVFPNPTTGTLTVSGLSGFSKGSAISLLIMDVSGKTILTKRVDGVTNTETVDTGFLAPGVYLISLQTDTQRVSKRFIKQ